MAEGQTIAYSATLTITSCWCGINVAIPSDLYRQARENGKTVYCPIGHTFMWSETELDRARAKAEKAEEDRKWYAQRLQAERELREDTERRLRAQRGETTKAKKRAAAAVCPCCNRSFVQLRRHMASKHPDYAPSATKAA